jgi:ABC-type dipeptide/oligopeptide/nickel transport system permease component
MSARHGPSESSRELGTLEFNLLLGILLLSSLLVIVTNLLVDLLYTRLDPRIELG